MTPVRAFVGHSFLKEDERTVRTFLDYFDSLSSSGLDFQWEHAEGAEPSQIADKVMGRIADKNAFIGICTGSERVVSPLASSRKLFGYNFLKETDAVWKTSDWIIQEIGLALGLGLKCLLLIERGVRTPGGLQGDIEYIQFDRSVPERSFNKITQMIGALSLTSKVGAITPPSVTTVAAEGETDPDKDKNEDWLTPKPDWKRFNYEFVFRHMILRDRLEDAEGISTTYLRTEEASRDGNEVGWRAFTEYTRFSFGKSGTLDELRRIAEANPKNSSAYEFLARGYKHYKEFEKAAGYFKRASELASDPLVRQRLLRQAGVEYLRAGLAAEGSDVVADLKRTAEVDSATETQLLYALKEIAEISKDDDLALAAMERTVELEPSDTHTRFNLAYKHSEQGNNDLALLHYLRIPAQERGGATWNNLGVALNEFSLPAKSIEAYRQARDQGETLAMSNIARKFMFIGVLPEAKQLIDEAQKLGDYHQNVAQDVIKLRQIPEEEIKRQEEVITKAGPKGDFYKRFGRAASKPEPVSIAIDWIGPDGDLKISFDGKEFKAAGTYERPSPAYALGIFGDALQTSVKTERVRIEYSGRPRGRAIVGNVTREGSKPRSLLGDISNQTKFIMVLADGYSEIEVMEMPSGGDVKFYRLTAKATSSG